MADTPEEIAKHRRLYWIVGGFLGIGTLLTIAFGINLYHEVLTFLDFGEPGVDAPDVAVGLGIACFKASLVALIFMHLNHERGIIYKFLLFTVCFFLSLMVLTLFAKLNPINTILEVVLPQY